MLTAQLEVNPFVGLVNGDAGRVVGVGPTDGPVDLDVASGYALGVRAFYGKNQLVPIAGLSYARRRTTQPQGLLIDDWANRWRGELGLAYRVRGADTSFNLMPSAAAVVYDQRRDGGTGVQARVGVDLFFDFIVLGAHYYPAFNETDAPATAPRASVWILTLGGRF